MKEYLILNAVLQLMRVQKHDVLNHLQVIAGYLQVKKMEKAQDYLGETIREITENGLIMRLRKPLLALSLMCKQLEVFEEGLNLRIINHTDLAETPIADEDILDRILPVIDNWAATAGKTGRDLVLLFREDEESYLVEYGLGEVSFSGQGVEAGITAFESVGLRNRAGTWQVLT